MYVYLYVHNKYTQYTHIYNLNKNFYFGWKPDFAHLTIYSFLYTLSCERQISEP